MSPRLDIQDQEQACPSGGTKTKCQAIATVGGAPVLAPFTVQFNSFGGEARPHAEDTAGTALAGLAMADGSPDGIAMGSQSQLAAPARRPVLSRLPAAGLLRHILSSGSSDN
nr:hypothetical protein [Microbulbifer zhoushanensis]